MRASFNELALRPNMPLDLITLESLLADEGDLSLVWPDARVPFDHEQWRATLTARPGNKSYFVLCNKQVAGHAALLETEESGMLAVSYLYMMPERRGQGLGYRLVGLIEDEAKKIPGTTALRLRVRTYNPRAMHIYQAHGFAPVLQDGTLIIMGKQLS